MKYPVSVDAGARVRIDKWLWAARFFKTRSQAADAVDKGRVRINGQTVKPAKEVAVGDMVRIEIDRLAREVAVRGVADVRGPATVAQTLYSETEASVAQRTAELERRRLYREPGAVLQGRPTKRDRRLIGKISNKA